MRVRYGNRALLPALAFALLGAGTADGAAVGGVVRELAAPGDPVAGARMTLFTPGLSFFRETRSGPAGDYTFANVLAGTYRLGCAAVGRQYAEPGVTVPAGGLTRNFSLVPENETGSWDIIGDTGEEFFDATDIALLLPDGRTFYCHDTTDPVLFDPVSGASTLASASGSPQGCMNGSLLEDGSVILAGGQDGEDPGSFVNGIPWVKRYDWTADAWEQLADLEHDRGRWYPGMARLADGTFLVMGGGQSPDASRTASCERFEPLTRTWSYTDSMANPCEFPPSALLYTGEVLATWSPPQLYNPAARTWRLTGNFNQPNRGWPGHSDHSIVVLDDGRALALGILSGPGGNDVMGEIYDPASESWALTSNPALVRLQTEVVQLPDGKILVAGGETEASPPPVPHVLGIVRWCDLYDPAADAWRRVADMNWFREYHAVTLLLPDGRVTTTGGTRIKFSYGPTSSDIEAYSPPYLFRGVRPAIDAISTTEPARGATLTLQIAPETQLTSVVLMGVESTTHWVSGGIPRRLVLPVSQSGATASATLPADPNVLPLGYYMLFAMVDDIPSVAVILRVHEAATAVDESAAPRPGHARFVRLAGAPNPFRGAGAVEFELARAGEVSLSLYDTRGRHVRRLVDRRHYAAGSHRIAWDGADQGGRPLPSGVYLLRAESAGDARAERLVLLR